MKKTLALILALLMLALPITSCDTSEPIESDTATEAPITEAPEPESESLVTDAETEKVTEPKTEAELARNDEELFVGYARECITPYGNNGKVASGITLTGYATPREAKTVKNDLFASCTAVKDKEGDLALIFTLDLHAITPEFANELQRVLKKNFDLPEKNIILNVTHTHAAPGTGQIRSIVAQKVILAAKAAIDDLTLVTELYTGTVKIDGMNFIRRYIYDDNGNPIAHISDVDNTMPVVRFVREGDKKDVILANWAAHCDTVNSGDPNAISSDYVGYFRDELEKRLDALVSLHMAASGDVNPSGQLVGEPRHAITETYGMMLALKLTKALDSLERQEIKSDVKALSEDVKVFYDHSEDADGPKAVEVMELFWGAAGSKQTPEVRALLKKYGFKDIYDAMYVRGRYNSPAFDRLGVGALSIGNVVFGVAPYEMFAANGKNIKDSADEFDLAFMCAYSNGMIGYIASEEAFKYDIYEVYSRLYVKETATILQDSIISMIDELGK